MSVEDSRSGRTIRIVLGAVAAIALAFAAVTLVALEGPEVVVLRTRDPEGGVRETRVWIADHGGFAWIEAANSGREFYRHIVAHPEVELRRNGQLRPYRAVPLVTLEGHLLIRRLLAEKYGWADRWIGLVANTSQSIAIRLEPR